MFVTLVVALPSQHEGGDLVVTHCGKEVRFVTGGPDSGDADLGLKVAAFYADCEHVLEPITAGIRAVLVYNLVMVGKREGETGEDVPTGSGGADGVALDGVEIVDGSTQPNTTVCLPSRIRVHRGESFFR